MSRHLLLRVYPTYRRNFHLSNQLRLLSTSGIPNPGKSDQKSHYSGRNSSSANWKICGIAIGIISSVLGINSYLKKRDDAIIFPGVLAATITPSARRKEFNVIADVVEVAAPAVVNIQIKDMRRYDISGQPLTASNGSGFIVDSDGLILTNAHVVNKQPHSKVQVRLADGRTFPGVVEDLDFASDLATLRISSKNLPTLKLGESSNLRAGEWVVALGSPLSLSNTVTAGVVSFTQRDSQELGLIGRDIKYIQTDAAITFGNSGGPLVNLDGEAIGINSMKVSPGISFAIPIDYVKDFLNRGKGRIRRGDPNSTPLRRRYVGITMLSLTQEIIQGLKHLGQPIPYHLTGGVFVVTVILDSPAYIGGLIPKDIITEINGKPIKTTTDVCYALAEAETVITMVVYRGLEKLTITMYPKDNE